jgi:sialate O-acetylesterase
MIYMWRYSLILFFSLSLSAASSQIRLPRLLSNNAVLQRDKQLRLFGWSSPGEEITISLDGRQFRAHADNSGEWSVTLPAQKAGGPHQLTFSCTKNEITLNDILFGDVWLCSGQSNMELTMDRVKTKYRDIIAKSTNAHIRHFDVPDRYDFKDPQQDLAGGSWKTADPAAVLSFSAVAYFFAAEVYAKHRIPIGLINASLGGSPAESWMSEDALKEFPEHLQEAMRFRNERLIAEIETSDRNRINSWYAELGRNDAGVALKWKSQNTDDAGWDKMEVPGYWADTRSGSQNGVVWFRRNFNVNASQQNQPAKILLGRIVDQDSVFINGQFVGTTSYQYPPREYMIRPGVLQAGDNVVSVKLISQSGRGGFVPDKPYLVVVGNDTIDLKGEWRYRMGAAMESLAGPTFIRWKPLGLYNGMIAPLHPFPICGVIWYQGEANAGRPAEYAKLFPALIRNWRAKWEDEFPFLYVQLANFMETKTEPAESGWAELREAQRQTQKLPKTGMAVAIDVGEWNDIHPLDKQTVGRRLALLAGRIVYGEEKLVASGPEPGRWKVKDGRVVIEFKNATGGLVAKDPGVQGHFAISADGKKFVWAKARIEKNTVIVWHEEIAAPQVIRYAWADNPSSANLYNTAGLPAGPFVLELQK